MPINPIPQPVDVVVNPSGESPKVKDFIINAPLIVQSTNVKDKLSSLDTTTGNLSQRVAALEAIPNNSIIQAQNISTGSHTSGTIVNIPSSPFAGDTYVVTSGTQIGDYYQCFVNGVWELIAYDHAPLAPSCVARWKLEDDNSATIIDSLGTYNLTYAGSQIYQNQPSPWKTCMAFSESLPVSNTINGASSLEPPNISILAWVCRFGGSTYGSYIILKRQKTTWGIGPDNNASAALYISDSNLLGFYIFDEDGFLNQIESPANLVVPIGKWVRVIGTFSPTTGMKLYIDGRLVNSMSVLNINYQDHQPWAIGANIGGSGVSQPQGFNGFIRDVQICNTALTSQQVLEDYERGFGIKRFTIAST